MDIPGVAQQRDRSTMCDHSDRDTKFLVRLSNLIVARAAFDVFRVALAKRVDRSSTGRPCHRETRDARMRRL
jgi:hypothetical protein